MYSLDGMLGGSGGGMDGLMGIGMGGTPATPQITFKENSDCDGEKFQTLWM